jgi:hypothetical protein
MLCYNEGEDMGDICWECDMEVEEIQHHHVVPRSRGGTKTVPLCIECHNKAHHMNMNMHHSTLVRKGLEQARRNGKILGNPRLAEFRHLGHKSSHEASVRYIKRLVAIIQEIKTTGVKTQADVANCLNLLGIKTSRGYAFTQGTISYILEKHRQHKEKYASDLDDEVQ